MAINFRRLTVGTLTASLLLPLLAPSAMANSNPAVEYNPDGSVRCVKNGWGFRPTDGYAPALSCFNTAPVGGVENLPAALAEVNHSLTIEDLETVENTSVLSPGSQIGADTYAAKPLTGKEPVSALSREMTADFQASNYAFNSWSTGENAGQVGDAQYAAHENIPVYTVDSSNPYQNYIWVQATDPRATSVPGYGQIMAGKIPFPKWALKDRGRSGDKSVAIYDKATGIWRSMYFFGGVGQDGAFVDTTENPEVPLAQTADGLPIYTYASGGYILGEPNFQGLGEKNYWATLQGGTSSVAGMANELTQIGVDEIRAGVINHAISMTAADYDTHPASFPAKQSDGRVNMVVSEGDARLDGSEVSKRYRVSSFASGKIDTASNDRYRRALEAMAEQGLVTLSGDYSILSSTITQETDVQALAAKHGLDRRLTGYAADVVQYLAEGDMLTVSDAPMPYIPKTGQRFTIPADVDVEALADAHGLSEFDRMRLRAIQKYGGILTDRNAAVHAFNLEAAASYAPYAREGKNVYLEDPEIVQKLEGSNSHKFPWQAVVWLDENYAGPSKGDNGVKDLSTPYKLEAKDGQAPVAYLPDSYNDQVYAGQSIFMDPTNLAILPPATMFHAPWFTASYDEQSVSHRHDEAWQYKAPNQAHGLKTVAELNTTGFVKVDPVLGRMDRATLHPDEASISTPGAGLVSLREAAGKRTTWNVETVDRTSPIARTDTVQIVQGQVTVFSPLDNDEPYFGAKAKQRATHQKDSSWARDLVLVTDDGQHVKELTAGGVTFTVTANHQVRVDATSAQPGLPPAIRYQWLRAGQDSTLGRAAGYSNGTWSSAGFIQGQVFTSGPDAQASAPETAEPSPEPTTPAPPVPTTEPTAVPSAQVPVAPVEPSLPVVPPAEEPTAEPSTTPTLPVPTVEPTQQPEPSPSKQEPSVSPVPSPSATDSGQETSRPTPSQVQSTPATTVPSDVAEYEKGGTSTVEVLPAPTTTPSLGTGLVPETGLEGQQVEAQADSQAEEKSQGFNPALIAVGTLLTVGVLGAAGSVLYRKVSA